jgi:serine-type D-Ala-D-Ala carboxypeptidase/endopeptidase (penicillin-binding protein 4)
MSFRFGRTLRITAPIVLVGLLGSLATETWSQQRRRAPRPVQLVWHVETLDGQTVTSKSEDEPINPASVIKVATSLWALEKLGPDFRFETRVFARGEIDPDEGVLRGDLVVRGSGDPDFHLENAFLLAEALERHGIRRVTGALMVDDRFWIGWEGGSARTEPDAERRARVMAFRLRRAMDANRWDEPTRRVWRDYASRRGIPSNRPPRIQVAGGLELEAGEEGAGALLAVHRAPALSTTLRRFNCFSNNDMERVGDNLGVPDDLGDLLAERLGAPREGVQFETTSGLGTNRMTPRQIVRMLREFRLTANRLGIEIEELLPVAGCDPGTLLYFPNLQQGENGQAVAAKTGTLTATDGGITVLAGFANTARGDLVFAVAAPRAAGRLNTSRRAEERWLLDLLKENGGAVPRLCAPPLPAPDEGAEVVLPLMPQAAAR